MTKQVQELDHVIIRFAGDSGDGMQLTGDRFTQETAVFGNDLVRVHSVNRKTNPAFWKLLTKFGEATGVPVLLNTSFNLFGEPVVSTPREAVRGFYCSGIDCLTIGNFLIKK